jgi:hypothetical protein
VSRRLCWLLLCGWLLLALVGCASSTTYHLTLPPCASPTPTGGTGTCDAVVITTDRAVYGTRDEIHVTITNQIQAGPYLHFAVLLMAQSGSCSGIQAERWQENGWENVPVCTPTGGDGGAVTGAAGPTIRIIEPGQAYDTYLAAGNRFLDTAHRAPFPTGTYQLVVQYALRVDHSKYGNNRLDGGDDGFTLYSRPFRVCASDVCP